VRRAATRLTTSMVLRVVPDDVDRRLDAHLVVCHVTAAAAVVVVDGDDDDDDDDFGGYDSERP